MSGIVTRDSEPREPVLVAQPASRQQSASYTAADDPASQRSSLLSPDVTAAILLLQQRRDRASKYAKHNGYKMDQCDRALDALLRHPDRTGDPPNLASKALSSVRKTVRRRTEKMTSMDALAREPVDRDDALDHMLLDLADVLDDRRLRAADRIALRVKLFTDDDADVAVALGVPIKTIPVRLSRARGRAKRIWDAMDVA